MLRPLRILTRLRWSWLVYTLPPVLLWAKAFPAAGALIVGVHSLLVLLHGVLCDLEAKRNRRELRLTVMGPRIRLDEPSLVPAAGFLTAGAAALCVVLLIPAFRVATLAMVSTALVLLTGGIALRLGPGGSWRARFNEVVRPVVALVLPMMSLREIALSNQVAQMSKITGEGDIVTMPGLIEGRPLAATVLWAVMMGVFVLACLTRDEADDRAAGLLTTPKIFGPRGATIAVVVWAAAALVLACWGLTHHHWGWVTTSAVGVGAIAAAWGGGAQRTTSIPGVWTLATLIGGLALLQGS